MARPTNKPGKTTRSTTRTMRPAAAPPATTAVRNTAIPKAKPAPAAKAVTHEMIARRAYEISRSPQCGSEFDNWVRAEQELRSR